MNIDGVKIYFFCLNITIEKIIKIIEHEKEVVSKWKAEGILENLFLRQGNGAILIFKGLNESEVISYMQTLPLYQLQKNIEYHTLTKQF